MLASPAAGQGQACSDRNSAVEHLARKYQESPVARGVSNRGHMIELFVSPQGETWTLVVSSAQGMSCIIVHGEDWRPIEPKPEGTAL